jgi:Nuclease-related domain
MVLRRRRTDGAEFWGCSRFPACRGIRQGDKAEADAAAGGAVAGGSARAEFERQADRHREVMRVARPRILLLLVAAAGFCVLMSQVGPYPSSPLGPSIRVFWLLAIFPIASIGLAALLMPSHIRAWEIGASGEEAVGRILERLEPDGFRTIHDRKIPGSRANIDHIVVGPTGVFVVETKSYEGRVRVNWGRLMVGSWNKSQFIDQVKREAAAVEPLVAPIGVTPLICFYRGDLGWELFPTRLDGVRILGPHKLPKALLQAPTRLTPQQVISLSGRIESGLSAAVAAR